MATMEGWLQVPAERNLMGRAGTWKSRYVRFGTYSPTTPTTPTPTTPTPAVRPTTATGVVAEQKPHIAGNDSEYSPSLQQIHLALYKQKGDAEPVARYPISAIASCYIGDIAPRHNKKKSIVLPTLIVNLRAEIQLSSKSFRRRSHDQPTREGSTRRERAGGREILYFRPGPESAVAIEKWSREIQAYLLPADPGVHAGKVIEGEVDIPASSLFFVNGEPSTALLSPSIRSRASNLSSVGSDDKGSVVSSELPADVSPRSSGVDSSGRPPLHVVTKMRHASATTRNSSETSDYFTTTPIATAAAAPPVRRETILDRFFSSTAPSSPNFPPDHNHPAAVPAAAAPPMNSIARFEALIRDIEYGHDQDLRDRHPDLRAHPKRIPSPTQRALEYVSTGLLLHHPSSSSSSHDNTTETRSASQQEDEDCAPDVLGGGGVGVGVGAFARSLSRQTSEASLNTMAGYAETNLGVPGFVGSSGGGGGGKRHSLADFSVMRLSAATTTTKTTTKTAAATPPMFQLAGSSRRGSHSDVPRISEAYEEDSAAAAVGVGLGVGGVGGVGRGEFGAHLCVGRPLFREFSF